MWVSNGVPLDHGLRRYRGDSATEGSPWRLLPVTLGDFAIMQVSRSEDGAHIAKSIYAGFFNEKWQ